MSLSNWAVLSLGPLDSEVPDATDDLQVWVSEDIWGRMNDVSIDGDATRPIFTMPQIHRIWLLQCRRTKDSYGFL